MSPEERLGTQSTSLGTPTFIISCRDKPVFSQTIAPASMWLMGVFCGPCRTGIQRKKTRKARGQAVGLSRFKEKSSPGLILASLPVLASLPAFYFPWGQVLTRALEQTWLPAFQRRVWVQTWALTWVRTWALTWVRPSALSSAQVSLPAVVQRVWAPRP